MFFKKEIKVVLFLLTLIILTIFIYLTNKNIIGTAKVKCIYMMYACGDCSPQYKVIDIISLSNEKFDSNNILNKDIYVNFNEEADQDLVDNSKCIICHEFELTGTLKRHGKTYELQVESANITLIPECCE